MKNPGRLVHYFTDSLRELWVRPDHQIPALDAIRAIAVIAVILSHFYPMIWNLYVLLPEPPLAGTLPFYYGWTGVDLFFILSGYLIGRQLWREKQNTGTIQVWEFIVRRGFRIWPLYFSMIFLGFISGAFQPKWPDLFFLSNYFDSGFPRTWTLSTEEQFYIAVPLLLAFTPGIKNLYWYFWILGGIVVSVWINRYFACNAILSTGVELCKSEAGMVYPIHLHNEALIVGLGIALLSVVRPDYFKKSNDKRFSWRGFAFMVVACGVAGILYFINTVIFTFTAIGLIFGSVTLWLMWDRSMLSSPANWRIWYPISRLSFGMYLNHLTFFPIFITAFTLFVLDASGSPTVASIIGVTVGIAVSMVFSVFTFVLVERPFLLWRAKWVAARKRKYTEKHESGKTVARPPYDDGPVPTGLG